MSLSYLILCQSYVYNNSDHNSRTSHELAQMPWPPTADQNNQKTNQGFRYLLNQAGKNNSASAQNKSRLNRQVHVINCGINAVQ